MHKEENWDICKAKVSYRGPHAYLKFYPPGKSIEQTPFWTLYFTGDSNSFKQLDLPDKGEWKIVVDHGIDAFTSVQNIFLDVDIDEDSPLKEC